MPRATAERRSLRREQIVGVAFEAWGRSVFFRTRLRDVAARLRMTKAALYRYFRSKDELLDAMRRRFLGAYAELDRQFQAEAAALAPAEAVGRFIAQRIAFFAGHQSYFYFMLHRAGAPRDTVILTAMVSASGRLASALERVEGIGDPAVAASYLRATYCFFLIRSGMKNDEPRPRPLDEQEVGALSSLVAGICARGYGRPGARGLSPPDFAAIERSCAVAPADVADEDPVLAAVAEAVSRHGFAGASLERIAQCAGMTKSSLYFHFRGRQQMLTRLLQRHHERLHELFSARALACTGAAARIYGFLVVLATYFRAARGIPEVLIWFRTHGFRFRVSPPDEASLARWFAFVEHALREGSLRSPGLSASEIGRHLSFVVVQHLTWSLRSGGEASLRDLRQIYDLFVRGYEGAAQ